MVTERHPSISQEAVAHADKALGLLDDLTREVLLVKDGLGYDTQALARKRRLSIELTSLAELKERLNQISLVGPKK